MEPSTESKKTASKWFDLFACPPKSKNGRVFQFFRRVVKIDGVDLSFEFGHGFKLSEPQLVYFRKEREKICFDAITSLRYHRNELSLGMSEQGFCRGKVCLSRKEILVPPILTPKRT